MGVLETAWDIVTAQEPLLRFLVAGFAIILALIAGLAWHRTRHPRIKWIGLAFATFVVNGVLLVAGMFVPGVEQSLLFATIVLELVVLVLLYLAVLQRME